MLAKDASKRRQCLGHVAACSMTILSDIAFFDYFFNDQRRRPSSDESWPSWGTGTSSRSRTVVKV